MTHSDMALWGGIECTINRVGDRYFNQCENSGHFERLSDFDLVAGLGIRTLRYPVLWEQHAAESPERVDFGSTDVRLERMRSVGIEPIATLLHHGSGPRYTSLMDPEFPEKLAAYAGRVARQYPWLEMYTPVNEPLTTARFSGLYGHWYPHGRDEKVFARCLLNEVKGVVLAMRAIRAVNPKAKLVQTEDLAKVHATQPMQYQADFENERRWLSFDLLSGQLTKDRRMYGHLRWLGIEARALDWFVENGCAPDVMGMNYYVTSERFLDHRVELYPAEHHAGNHRHRYADVAACHVLGQGPAGLGKLLQEAHQRYGLPMAVTEAHLGCTREEQVRWLTEMWREAESAKRGGADVCAVTVWCLFGAHDWNSLVTRDDHHYEPGVFDIRAPKPRPTALARVCARLAGGQGADGVHPVAAGAGWWRRPERFIYAGAQKGHVAAMPPGYHRVLRERPVVIAGAQGRLGRMMVEACRVRGLAHVALGREEMDISSPGMVREKLGPLRPWAVINCAARSGVDYAERHPGAARQVNAIGPAILAETCAGRDIKLLTFSSDLVFNGLAGRPYVETDSVQPLNEFGRTKADADRMVLGASSEALVIRTGPLFGLTPEKDPVGAFLKNVAAGRTVWLANDEVVSPTYAPDLVNAALDLLVDDAEGLWHCATQGAVTWEEFARMLARAGRLDEGLIAGIPGSQMPVSAVRPAYSALASVRHRLMVRLEDAVARCVSAIPADVMRHCEEARAIPEMRVA